MQKLHVAQTVRSMAPDDETDEKDVPPDKEMDKSLLSPSHSDGCGKEDGGKEGAGPVGGGGDETKTQVPNLALPQAPVPAPPSPRHVEDDQRQCIEQFLKSARAGHVGSCLYYVLFCEVSLSHQDDRGNTALHLAAAQVLPLTSRSSAFPLPVSCWVCMSVGPSLARGLAPV